MQEQNIKITIFASLNKLDSVPFGIMNFGHSFIALKNCSHQIINIVGYQLMPNEEITIGSWPISHHFGIWFNIEASYVNRFKKYIDRVSLTKELPLSSMEVLNQVILQYKKWTIKNNCTYFALNIWNRFANDDEIFKLKVTSPKKLYRIIETKTNFDVGKIITYNEKVGYYRNNDFIQYAWELSLV